MISPKGFYSALETEGVAFLSGVPDSLLKDFCAYVDAVLPSKAHTIAANEGSAIALAAGFHLATGKIPLVYLQNSGLGNTINPLLSLADSEVYSLPMILMIGWRGKPGLEDEPQHIKQGRVTPALLDTLEIPWREVTGDPEAAANLAVWATRTAVETSAPVALLVHKGAFSEAETRRPNSIMQGAELTREHAITLITAILPKDTLVVATTGMISRELYEQRIQLGQDRSNDFLTVGSMGHASQIALGISQARGDLDVACLDGDGAALMHMGGLATIGASEGGNLLHIVLNNGVHDSVGGQPTVAQHISLSGVAKACGYDSVADVVATESELIDTINRLAGERGSRFAEVRVTPGSRTDLGRPKETPVANRDVFIGRLRPHGSALQT